MELSIRLLSLNHGKMTEHLPCEGEQSGVDLLYLNTKLNSHRIRFNLRDLGDLPAVWSPYKKILHPGRCCKSVIADGSNTRVPKTLWGLRGSWPA